MTKRKLLSERVPEMNRHRTDRIVVRKFLDRLQTRLKDYGDRDGIFRYPGSQMEVSEPDWDGQIDSVKFYLVTATEFKKWLADLAPPRLSLLVSTTDESATGWYVECDDCGVLVEGDMTPYGHDLCVRALYEHDKEKHGGDGVIPYQELLVRENP